MSMNQRQCKCGKHHKTKHAQHACFGKQLKKAKATEKRNSYDAVISWEGKGVDGYIYTALAARTVIDMFSYCLEPDYVDFDLKGRGDSLNHDLYGYNPNEYVAVIQARHAFRRSKNHFLGTHKTYFLCGFNELTGAPFRHPISSAAIRGAIRAGADAAGVVIAAQKWMWKVTDKQLAASVRQGDLLLVPEKREPQGDYKGMQMVLARSHGILADEIRMNGRVYALNPILVHAKGQHAPVTIQGWASARVARDAAAWDFAVRIGD